MKRPCTCDRCKKDFTVERFSKEHDILRDGTPLLVLCFYCPNCNERYVADVTSDQSIQLAQEYYIALDEYNKVKREGKTEDEYRAKKEMEYKKKKFRRYSMKLYKQYLKRVKHRGY